MPIKTIKGEIKVGTDILADDSLTPSIIEFVLSTIPGDDDRFEISFSTEHAHKVTLIQKIGEDQEIEVDVGQSGKFAYSYDEDSIIFKLKAVNTKTNVEVTETLKITQTISAGSKYTLIADVKIKKEDDSLDQINITIKILQKIPDAPDFDPQKIQNISLYYRHESVLQWRRFAISKQYTSIAKNQDGSIQEYCFEKLKAVFERGVIGGNFLFYVGINVRNFKGFVSELVDLNFDNIPLDVTSGDQTFPEAEIMDNTKPARLRYEIKVKFSEAFIIRRNTRSLGEDGPKYYPGANDKSQIFLDTEEVPGLILHDSPYLFAYANDQETQGYLYPASVSEILPCILIFKDLSQSKTEKIILFWKINDNFFDYSFFLEQIQITTTSLIVKIQYKGTDLTGEIKLTKETHFNPKTNKFVLGISYGDVLSGSINLFNEINEKDNYSDNLKIVIVSHQVYCKGVPERSGAFNFDKLLMPHEWKYICYDKFIGANAAARIPENRLSLSLISPYLRGLRIPEKGFSCYDELTGLQTAKLVFDLKIFYKLSSETEIFYIDPVMKGTINSIELPSLPDDVFLTPPVLTIAPPNLAVLGEAGYQQAEGIVRLNQYGKISSVELTVLGQGYSQYKNGHQRIQSEYDIIPTVFADYCFTSNNLNINKKFLNIENLSFDRVNLWAGLEFGVRLSNVAADAAAAEAANQLSADQRAEVTEYLERNGQEDVEVENNSTAPYKVSSKTAVTAKPLDVIWVIVSKLYSGSDSIELANLSIYNQDVDPGVTD